MRKALFSSLAYKSVCTFLCLKKRLFYLVILYLFSLPVLAQPVLEKSYNMFRPGDKLTKQQMEFKKPGEAGADQYWDFSQLKTINENYQVSYLDYLDSLVVGREQRTLYKYSLEGDSLLFVGFENPVTIINHLKPELHLVFPVRYEDHHQDYYYGTGNYGGQLDVTLSGKFSSHADAYGTIVLPGGDTLRNVFRVHYTKKQLEKKLPHYSFSVPDSIFSTDSIEYCLATDTLWTQTDTYRWYAEGYRYPVFETIENTLYLHQQPHFQSATSFYYPPHEQYYGLENDTDNTDKRERMASDEDQDQGGREKGKQRTPGSKGSGSGEASLENKGIDHTVYLSNDNDLLIVEYNLEEPMDVIIMLFDMQGRILEKYPKVRQERGSHHQHISLEKYPRGEYLLRIMGNENIYGEKITKR